VGNAPHPIALITTPGRDYEHMGMTGIRYDDIRPGCYDGAARAAAGGVQQPRQHL